MDTNNPLVINISLLPDGKASAHIGSPTNQIVAQNVQAVCAELFSRDPLIQLNPNGWRLKVSPWGGFGGQRVPITLECLLDLLMAARMGARLDLSGCNLSGIDASPAELVRIGADRSVLLGDSIDLSGVSLRDARLDNSNFDSANFRGAEMAGVYLRNASLRKADFSNADLTRAFLNGAQLEEASFFDSNLQEVYFYGASLKQCFLARSSLERAKFGQAVLDGSSFWDSDLRLADFRNAKSAQRVRWHAAGLERTFVYRRNIDPIAEDYDSARGRGSFRTAMEAYASLKTNFESIGNYEDASWAYLKEQQMEKASYFPTTAGKHRISRVLRRCAPSTQTWPEPLAAKIGRAYMSTTLHIRFFLGLVPPGARNALRDEQKGGLSRRRWFRNWSYEILTGYGERPQMPVLWGAITIVTFAIIFSIAGNLSETAGGQPTHDFLTALTQSIAAFATIGFNDLQPVGWGARMLTAIEAMLGIGFFALFVYTLGNRMSRS